MAILSLRTLRKGESTKLRSDKAISGGVALDRFLIDNKKERLSNAARRVLTEKGKIIAIIELFPHDGVNPYLSADGCEQSLWLIDLSENEDSTEEAPPYLLVSTLGEDEGGPENAYGFIEVRQGETLHIGRLVDAGSFRPDNSGRFSCRSCGISRQHFDIKCDSEGIWVTDLSKYGTRIVTCEKP